MSSGVDKDTSLGGGESSAMYPSSPGIYLFRMSLNFVILLSKFVRRRWIDVCWPTVVFAEVLRSTRSVCL